MTNSTFLTKVFYAVLCKQFFAQAWKHARVVSIPKSEKIPVCLVLKAIGTLDSVGKLLG